MTRDEVIKIVMDGAEPYVCSAHMAGVLVDTWAAVGMLRLDEPASVYRRAAAAIGKCIRRDFDSGFVADGTDVITALDDIGLKIVEK